MVHRLPFITGVSMLVLAGTLAFVATSHDEAGSAATAGAARGNNLQEAATPGAWPPEAQTRSLRSELPDQPGRASRPRASSENPAERNPATPRTDLKVQVMADHPRREELAAIAARVESSALRQLEKLTVDLDLTADQQTRIFPILVRGSQSYDPGMQIVDGRGSHGSSAPLDPQQQQELLQQELDLPQAEALVNLSARDLMIWEELINDLTRQLDQATPGQVAVAPPPPAVDPEPEREVTGGGTPADEPPATSSEPPPVVPPPPPPESHGGRDVFDRVPGS
jgi:hypothetical protein